MFVVKRSSHNPILAPAGNHWWEASATFNLCPIKKGDSVYGFYRAMSFRDKLMMPEQISTIGLSKSKDGEHFEGRERFLEPEDEWEQFGIEDPRVTFFEGCYYLFYTALSTYPFSADGIKVAVAVTHDLQEIEERHLITPFNAKAMTLFPERVGGKVTAIFSAHTDSSDAKMSIVQVDNIEELWSPDFWDRWHENIDGHVLDVRRNNYDHVEVGAPPIKTEQGWLMIYSHIQNYFPGGGERVFGIEALLLDLNNPQKIIGRSGGPIMVPEAPYELVGHVPNVIFPSGAILDGEILNIYYGSADTTTSIARVYLRDLISSILPETKEDYHFKREDNNPILEPISEHPWESKAVFNPAAIDLSGKVHLLYRALSGDNTSTMGYAVSTDAVTINERLPDPVYVPREDFEGKKIPEANSGCEDPRITKIGRTLYVCYTAFDGVGPPRVAVSSIEEKDFLERRWNWSKPALITPQGVDDKDACILEEKVDKKFFILHRVGTDICGDLLDSLDFDKQKVNKCIRIFGPRKGMWDSGKVGITGPPVKTHKGWLLLYHASSEQHKTYRVGAVLLDLKDPSIVLARSTDPLFSPEEPYEKEGIVNNVVFPCGIIVRDGLIYSYYGGADKVVGVATMKLAILEEALSRGL